MSFEGFPHIIGWELTLACNLRCRHCASAAGLPRDNELTLEEALALCDQFPALIVKEVHLTGGEPLLRPDWWKIAARLAERNITTRIVSNGLPLTKKRVSQMRSVGIDGVGVSLDGLETTHDAIRCWPGLFRRVFEGIERAAAAGLKVGVITAVNHRNLHELPELLTLLESSGVGHWQLQPNLPQGRSEEATDLHLSDQDYVELGVFFRDEQAKERENGFSIVPADSLGYFTELDLEEPPWRGCPAGFYTLGITSDGRVKGCLTLPDDAVEGNLRENDLWEIWFREDGFPYTRSFRVDRMGSNCKGCELAEQCRGGCSSMSRVCSGSFHNDPYCFHSIRKRNPRLFEAACAGAKSRSATRTPTPAPSVSSLPACPYRI